MKPVPLRQQRTGSEKLSALKLKFLAQILNINDSGDAVVWLAREDKPDSLRGVLYIFFFDGIPDEVTEIEKGDTVKISGRVLDFKKDENILIVRSVSSHIVK